MVDYSNLAFCVKDNPFKKFEWLLKLKLPGYSSNYFYSLNYGCTLLRLFFDTLFGFLVTVLSIPQYLDSERVVSLQRTKF
jgi:hypothetical protein